MSTRAASLAFALVAATLASACTLVKLNDDVHAREARVADAQAQLDAEQARQAALHDEMTRLNADLEQKQLSLAELQSRLAQLQQHNDQLVAANVAQLARKQDVQRQIGVYQARLAALAQDRGMSEADKRKKLQALHDELQRALKLMLLS
ncbi:hypothetical protein FSB08_17180 [Paraburkholderia sp. JPY432]|uniref:hypothetical protein n=1 Tax=Paraburkholderia youngii TaxID=2782701 RepID=UPI00159625A9|nr:hypothetical protein [Paraburkholderia youngii]NVH74236.1 hypothetical protein [Paraburkholderia youngii]